jgi:hypothetical protein
MFPSSLRAGTITLTTGSGPGGGPGSGRATKKFVIARRLNGQNRTSTRFSSGPSSGGGNGNRISRDSRITSHPVR